MTRHSWTPEVDTMTSAEQPEMYGRGRGRSLALIVHSGNSPIEVLPSHSHYHGHSRRLDSTVSFNSVWISGYKTLLVRSVSFTIPKVTQAIERSAKEWKPLLVNVISQAKWSHYKSPDYWRTMHSLCFHSEVIFIFNLVQSVHLKRLLMCPQISHGKVAIKSVKKCHILFWRPLY